MRALWQKSKVLALCLLAALSLLAGLGCVPGDCCTDDPDHHEAEIACVCACHLVVPNDPVMHAELSAPVLALVRPLLDVAQPQDPILVVETPPLILLS
jgi:hypothetical protein